MCRQPQSDADYALKRIDLSWRDGGAYALLGPSGCGKSTLLNIISGLLRPSEGQVLFDGRDVTDLAPDERHIAQVFQFPVTYDTMSVYDNLAFPLRNRGVDASKVEARVREIAEMLEISDRLRDARRGARARRQAEDLHGPRPGARRRQRDHVRRAADGDRPASEMEAALEAQGAASAGEG